MAVHRQRLAGDARATLRTEKEHGLSDIDGVNQRAQRTLTKIGGTDFTSAYAARRRLGLDYAFDSRAIYRARTDCIHPNPLRTQLHGQRLGQADQPPLGGGIWGSQWVAMLSCGRGDVYDGPAAARLQ